MTPSNEKGQMLIVFMLLFTLTLVVGVIVVDVGVWVTERRGASADADASSLAGVQAYFGDLTDTAGAFDDAVTWAALNGVDPAQIDAAPTLNCSADNSCIGVGLTDCRGGVDGPDSMPWVEAKVRRDGPQLFTAAFNVLAPNIGALARACVGSPRSLLNLSPFGIQTGFVPPAGDPESGDECLNDDDDDFDDVINDGCPLSGCMEPDPNDSTRTIPIYGRVCIMKTSQSANVSGQFGQLTIGGEQCDSTLDSSNLKHDFHYGTVALCTVDEEVNTGTGSIVGLLQGLNDRLVEEGLCDQLFSSGHLTYDDFDEVFTIVGAAPGEPVVPSPDAVFAENDCEITSVDGDHEHTYMPRALTLILIDQLEKSAKTATITGFAGFYVIGCFDGDDSFQVKAEIEQDLTNFDSYLNRCNKPTGKDDVLGIFVKEVAAPIFVGDPDPNLPLAIVLVK